MTREAAGFRELRTAAAALGVCVGYYVGAHFGFLLRFPPMTPSVMWPPNAILTTALLLAPPRHWWIYLFAALPAHLAAELGAGWPTSLVLILFVTNCSEALFAAWASGGSATRRRVSTRCAGWSSSSSRPSSWRPSSRPSWMPQRSPRFRGSRTGASGRPGSSPTPSPSLPSCQRSSSPPPVGAPGPG